MSEFVDAFIGPGPMPGTRAHALTTTRAGGVGLAGRATMTLGRDDGTGTPTGATNRARIRRLLGLPADPVWLRQVHGTRCVELTGPKTGDTIEADAAWTATPGVVCAVLTADCLPVALIERAGGAVGVAHAGWRGLAGGVLESAVAAMRVRAADLRAWLGPAIGPRVFEIGPEVRDACLADDPGAANAFRRGTGDRWFADLYTLARRRLHAAGVPLVEGGGWCTVSDAGRFFSHRRAGGQSGRMATLAWLTP